MIEATGDIRIQHVFRLKTDRIEDGFFRILGAAAGSKSIAIGLEVGFPFRFQCEFDQALMSPIDHDGYP